MNNKGNYSFIISGVIIAVAIIIGSYLSAAPLPATKSNSTPASASPNEDVFTADELADFLSIDKEKLEDIIEKDDIERASIQGDTFDTYQFIPYAIISGEHRFLKKEIMKWLEYQTHNRFVNESQ